MRRPAVLLLLALLLAAVPASAPAAWRLDRSFGARGLFERLGARWQDPAGALGDDAGGVLVWRDFHLLRVTAAGRADAAVDVPLRNLLRIGPYGHGRVLAYEWSTRREGKAYVADRRLRVVDRRGRVAPSSARFTKAMLRGDAVDLDHHLVPLADGNLADLAFDGDHARLRVLHASGQAGGWNRITWPGPWVPSTRSTAEPVRSSGRILVAGADHGVRGIVALTPGGPVDRSWGDDGLARLRESPRQLLVIRGGGVIAVADRHVTWLDRRGRVVARRAVRVGTAAVDAHGRLLVARSGDDHHHVSLLRFDTRRRLDRGFGRLTLRASGRVDPVAVVAGSDGRVAVAARRVAYEHYEDIREDFTDLVSRGTAIWKVRAR